MEEQEQKPLMAREELRDVIALSLWAGQMLLQNGADSQRVEETVHRIGTSLGCDWLDIVVMPDAIIASTVSHGDFRTKVRRAPGRGVDMQKIAGISDLSYRVTRGELDRFELRKALRGIDEAPRNYNRWTVVFGVGLACAAFSRLFGGDVPVFVITFLASSAAMFVRQELHKRYFNSFIIVVATAFVAGSIGSLASLFNLSPDPTIAIAASVLLLVPGVPLINAGEDLLHGHTLTGVLRGVNGVLIVMSIALGLIFVLLDYGGISMMELLMMIVSDAFWSALAAMGFAMLFNVPQRALIHCMIGGAIGHALRTLLMQKFGFSIELATLLSATAVGFCAKWCAIRLKMPSMIFAVSAVIPMVPGVFAYQTMIGILEATHASNTDVVDVLAQSSVNAIKTGVILASLAGGIVAPSLIFKRRKPVV